MKKIKLGILYGGRSAEHEVSINSAKNIIKALDKNKYEIKPIKIAKNGKFKIELLKNLDVVFPVLHGPYGEDGTVQGMLKFLDIPFVGPSILGSALGMDKEVMKRLMIEANIPIAKYLTYVKGEKIDFKHVKDKLGLPVFIKPANMGSSVGISKVNNLKDFKRGVEDAFLFDTKIIIEEMIKGREIECAVLGNEDVQASVLGEVIAKNNFYSYKAKYKDSDGAKLLLGVSLDKDIENKIQVTAKKVFKILSCEGMSRVDFFLKDNGKIIVNEINTIPGFTEISMYPKLFELSGISYKELLDVLIMLAFDRHKREKELKTNIF